MNLESKGNYSCFQNVNFKAIIDFPHRRYQQWYRIRGTNELVKHKFGELNAINIAFHYGTHASFWVKIASFWRPIASFLGTIGFFWGTTASFGGTFASFWGSTASFWGTSLYSFAAKPDFFTFVSWNSFMRLQGTFVKVFGFWGMLTSSDTLLESITFHSYIILEAVIVDNVLVVLFLQRGGSK